MTKSYRISKSIAAALIAAAVVICGIALTAMHVSGYDAREEAHGMNYVCDPVTGQSYLIWSDEYTSGTSQEGDWTHDIYYKPVDIDDPQAAKDTGKIKLIGAAVLCYPQGIRNIGFYRIGKKSIVCLGTRNAGVKWSYRGTSGFFDSDNSHVTFATLGKTGIVIRERRTLCL